MKKTKDKPTTQNLCGCVILHMPNIHRASIIAWQEHKNMDQEFRQKLPKRTIYSYFWWQTVWICTRILSVTMVLWSEYQVAFLGPAVCLWLADNDIMTDECADIKWHLQGKSSEVILTRTCSGQIWLLMKHYTTDLKDQTVFQCDALSSDACSIFHWKLSNIHNEQIKSMVRYWQP